ncbi:MAG: divalent-cation tolerance protein CutA [Lysobacteraceae bacterium]
MRFPAPEPAVAVLVCFCTCPDPASAERLAEALVGERLAACASLVPGVRSVYRWQGAVERADEVLLLVKTTRERLDALAARVRALHPHELPELVAVEAAGGLPAYLDWVAAESRAPGVGA